jgi:DNA-binding XRE family transcriptional regulator
MVFARQKSILHNTGTFLENKIRVQNIINSNQWYGIEKMSKNNLKRIRESLMISKAELSRNAKISPLTITRIERGEPCRMETKRKIVLALGLKISEKDKVFGERRVVSVRGLDDRRTGIDRRQFTYAIHSPENRTGRERRKEFTTN